MAEIFCPPDAGTRCRARKARPTWSPDKCRTTRAKNQMNRLTTARDLMRRPLSETFRVSTATTSSQSPQAAGPGLVSIAPQYPQPGYNRGRQMIPRWSPAGRRIFDRRLQLAPDDAPHHQKQQNSAPGHPGPARCGQRASCILLLRPYVCRKGHDLVELASGVHSLIALQELI